MTRKYFFYINSCYEDNEDIVSFVDRYVLRAQHAIRLILLRALCETGNTGIRNKAKSTEVYNRNPEHV